MGDATGHLLILGKSFEDRLERARRSLFLLVLFLPFLSCLCSPISELLSLHFKVPAVPIQAGSDPLDFFLCLSARPSFLSFPPFSSLGPYCLLPFEGGLAMSLNVTPHPTLIPLRAYFILFLIHENLEQVPRMEQVPNAMPGPHLRSEPQAPQVKWWKPKDIVQCWVALCSSLSLVVVISNTASPLCPLFTLCPVAQPVCWEYLLGA